MTGEGIDEADQRLTAGPKLGARERLEVYRRGYRARLLECLADDYPVLKHALGEEAFDALGGAYIARFPSTAPNLNDYGRHMAALCAEGGRAFEADLARLEWAIVEVIHAPVAPPLTMDRLAVIPLEAWGGARLVASRAVRVLRHEHPVNDFFQAVRDGRAASVPEREASFSSGSALCERAAPASSFGSALSERAAPATAVYRSGVTVWRMGLTPPMAAVLEALLAGAMLEPSLTHAAGEPPDRVMASFREWIAGGLFVDVRTPDRREGSDADTDVRTPDRREGSDADTDVRTPDRREGSDANADVVTSTE
jgi:hypothetical protein